MKKRLILFTFLFTLSCSYHDYHYSQLVENTHPINPGTKSRLGKVALSVPGFTVTDTVYYYQGVKP